MYDRKLAVVGFVLILAPLYFVSASLLEFGLGVGFLFDPLETFLSVAGRRAVFNAVSPFVFLGGLCLALALNTYAVVRLDVRREAGTLVGTVRLKLNLSNTARSQQLAFCSGHARGIRLSRKLHPPRSDPHRHRPAPVRQFGFGGKTTS